MKMNRILALCLAMILLLCGMAQAEGWTWNTGEGSEEETWYTATEGASEGEGDGEQAIQQFVRASSALTVRSNPSVNATEMGGMNVNEQVPFMGEVYVDEKKVVWYQVQFYIYGLGWISSLDGFLTTDTEVSTTAAGTEAAASPTLDAYVYGYTGDSYLRSGPGLGYTSLGMVLYRGQSATYLNQSSVDDRGVAWYYVNCNGKIGWVSSRYTLLSSQVPTGTFVPYTSIPTATTSLYVRATASVNVRSGPGLSYSDMGTLTKGEQVDYLGNTAVDDRGVLWYRVQYYSFGVGWVSSIYATLVNSGDTGVTTYPKQTSTGDGAYVKATGGKSNLRSGPGLDYTDIGTIQKGETAAYLGEQSTDERGVVWYKVRYNGKTGWVSSRYTTLTNDGGTSTKETSSGYVKATGGKSNLRSGPGLDYTDIGTIQKGETAAYLGEQSTDERGVVWYKVRYNGKTGWVSSRYTTLY